ncbi:MAG TPA: T9SS type A sorting domain-containing protein [Bacteroidales bacterium]|nr:T9SS type A sorting domain-containing protein [Bacteroidales bacterium]HRX96177.1 T9SS type A sorting domain-containing protein [Bacteroidales bacterium]
MKKLILLITISAITSLTFAQSRKLLPAAQRNKAIKSNHFERYNNDPENLTAPFKVAPSSVAFVEQQIGDTRYDNQSNASIPKKIVLFEDGTIGATWTRSMDEGSFFADRGTGYNYFNGAEWGDWPEERIEDIKVHRPTYAQWGENGEMVVSHTSGTGLYIATRPEKGTGDWDFNEFSGPPGEDYLVWNRLVTSGPDNTHVHLLALTLPESHGGQPYQGLDGALLYSYSDDGGDSWIHDNIILDGMASDEYVGFAGDTYAFAEPKDNIVAFVVGDPWTGLFLMKSTDGGENFTKTVIWEHPYPMWTFGTVTDTFYCADGAQSAVIDNSGKVHVAFGINRVASDASSTYWFPWVDGIAYWNEDMPAFSNNLNALNPYDHPDSELEENYNLIGWSQDIDNNGTLDFTDEIGLYWLGLSSMPQLVVNDWGQLYLVYSSVTEGYDNGLKNFRHLWIRAGMVEGQWWGTFIDLTNDLVHIFDECVYPACASNSDEFIHLIYQYDIEPGTAVWGAQHDYLDNSIGHMEISLYTDIFENQRHNFEVSQNFPNPVSGITHFTVELQQNTELLVEVSDLSGRIVYTIPEKRLNAGKHLFELDATGFTKGVYFYTVKAGAEKVTKKMVVD